ncbi:MAG: cyclase family protein [Natronomonas sp.]|jgi:kynurenine formamidase|uniref:cyclase family protein n=1 Tax=Natronomonas sp. TaxID=2184060 RepID=UPI0028704F07|nr:cyclase family protein [Natronomonas sp.]MDR9429419.1 cyclase family protein [Natronomonas sp.]
MLDSVEKIIDLSNPIESNIPTYPNFPNVRVETTDYAARDGFTMEKVEMRSHTATHVDAPLHFIPEGKTLDEFPIETFMGEGIVLDLTPKEPAEPIMPEDIEPFVDDIEQGDVVMLYTGWDDYYGWTSEYVMRYPFLSGEVAQYLAELEPKAVGIDTPSVAGWVDEVPAQGPVTDIGADESHVPLLENDIIPIEELRNLDQVLEGADSRRAYFFYPPLNLHGAGGASARAFAFL